MKIFKMLNLQSIFNFIVALCVTGLCRAFNRNIMNDGSSLNRQNALLGFAELRKVKIDIID